MINQVQSSLNIFDRPLKEMNFTIAGEGLRSIKLIRVPTFTHNLKGVAPNK